MSPKYGTYMHKIFYLANYTFCDKTYLILHCNLPVLCREVQLVLDPILSAAVRNQNTVIKMPYWKGGLVLPLSLRDAYFCKCLVSCLILVVLVKIYPLCFRLEFLLSHCDLKDLETVKESVRSTRNPL